MCTAVYHMQRLLDSLAVVVIVVRVSGITEPEENRGLAGNSPVTHTLTCPALSFT